MNENNEPAVLDVSELAHKQGIKQPVRVSASLAELLQPNRFLSDLGIRFQERMDTILSILNGSMVPRNGGPAETIPPGGIGIPFAITQGPFIREVPIAIRAELDKGDEGKAGILLSLIQEDDGI